MKHTKESLKKLVIDIFQLPIAEAAAKHKVHPGTIAVWRRKYKHLLGTSGAIPPLITALSSAAQGDKWDSPEGQTRYCPTCEVHARRVEELKTNIHYLEDSIAERDDQIESLKSTSSGTQCGLDGELKQLHVENHHLKCRIEELGVELGMYMRLVKHYMMKGEQ